YGGADPFDSGAVNALRAFQDTARFIGADITGMVCGSANDPGEIAANPAVLEQAFDLGQTLAAG
ncbi:MAG TPA: flavodoxin family protein, partial [Candidatus Aminicenantes bacterium]|nr:flavodoxin family protein [Candidatus Aminicenantes bacterium]